MLKRLLLKFAVLVFILRLPLVEVTNSYFTDSAVSSENSFAAGEWGPPESEAVDNLENYYNDDFEVDYTASDLGGMVAQVQLYYSFNGGDWQLLYTDTPGVSPASGTFTIDLNDLEGDGEYGFLTIAIDDSDNIEDDIDEDGVLDAIELSALFSDTSTIVDTSLPVTMLSVDPYMAVANELLYNGGFENGNLDGWTVDSVGSDHQATTDDQKTGAYSALIGFRDAALLVEPAYDSIEQTVSLPLDKTSTLSFWYHLITDDLVSGGFFDAFVTPTGSDPVNVAHDGWDDPLVLDEDLDWENVTYQLIGLEGEEIEIQFKVTQPDEDYQTWAYLDDVKVCAAGNLIDTSTDLSFSSHDGSGSNDSTITYSIDGDPDEVYTDPINLGEGEHTLIYSAEDEAGNVEDGKQIDVTVQADPVEFGVVLNEFLPDPGGDDYAAAPNGEWVELYNNSSNPVDVDGWKLEDVNGNQVTISDVKTEGAGTVVDADDVLKVYRRGSAEGAGPAFIMDNGSGTVKLLKPDDSQVDSYSYAFTIEGKSFARDPDGTGAWKDPEVEDISAKPDSGSSQDNSQNDPGLSLENTSEVELEEEKIVEEETILELEDTLGVEVDTSEVGQDQEEKQEKTEPKEEDQEQPEGNQEAKLEGEETVEDNDEFQEEPRVETQPEEGALVEKGDETDE